MERSFKKQGVITETIRDTWYKETLKKRQELGLDSPVKQEVKQEIKEEKPTIDEKKDISPDDTAPVVVAPIEPEPSKHDHQTPSVSGIKKLDAPSTSQAKENINASSVSAPKKNDNKDAVRAEIKEIEEKLRKKKQKKLAAKAADLEDGECDDSDDDADVATVPVVTAPLDPPTVVTNISDKQKQRDDNRKRWNEGRRSSTHSGDHSYRDSREGSHSRDRDRRHDRRDDRSRYHDRHYRS